MTRKTGGPWRLGLPGSLEKRAWRGCARSLGKQIAKSIGVRFVKDSRPSLTTPEGPQSALQRPGPARPAGLDHCKILQRAADWPESTRSALQDRPYERAVSARERTLAEDAGCARRGRWSSDHPAAVRLPSRSPPRARPSPSRASRSRRPVRRLPALPARGVICVTAPT
jgi:hypothetical protein